MHLTEGEIRSYQDQQIDLATARRIETHLAACADCRSKAQALSERAQRVQARLNHLQISPPQPIQPAAAHQRLMARLPEEMEEPTVIKKFVTSLSRPTWAVIALVAVLAISLAFPSVRAIANSFLQLFRVEQVRVISVDMDDLPGRMESSAQLEAFFSKNVQIEEQGEPQEVATLEEASALAGMPLRALAGEPVQYSYQPGGAATFTIDLELLRAVLREMGRSDVQLPDSLDGAVVKVQIPGSVISQVGDCQSSQRAGSADPDQRSLNKLSDCITFFQMPSPSVSAPPELDIAQLGQIYLQVLGMSETEAAQFASKVDWTTTFVIPIPQGSADYKEVQVDGVTGALLQFRRGSGPGYMLIWVKNGVVYVLSGFGNKNAALEAAAALK
ncbi:MAG: zf-HC2 domain-containing protein [Anaerolineales bacterium]|nr:zf-HC2 domain-containing protein [Anaerolineales bacterium]